MIILMLNFPILNENSALITIEFWLVFLTFQALEISFVTPLFDYITNVQNYLKTHKYFQIKSPENQKNKYIFLEIPYFLLLKCCINNKQELKSTYWSDKKRNGETIGVTIGVTNLCIFLCWNPAKMCVFLCETAKNWTKKGSLKISIPLYIK